MDKKVMLASMVIALLIFSGCGNKEKKDENSSKDVTSKIISKIKITKNVVKKDKTKEISKENSGQFYYSYNKEGKSKEAKEIDKYNKESSKQRTTIDAYLGIKNPYAEVKINMLIKRPGRDYIIKCSPCHNSYANGVIGPSLLGKDKEFIYQKIIEFKTGKRKNVLMKEFVEQISDKKLQKIAGEIETFNKQIEKMRKNR
ncbi:MAG: hypothetical protein GXP61_10320 [Epsilonproteobacteria bacterium]|nr:hypothetical protein [Campylobacterota bacterium]